MEKKFNSVTVKKINEDIMGLLRPMLKEKYGIEIKTSGNYEEDLFKINMKLSFVNADGSKVISQQNINFINEMFRMEGINFAGWKNVIDIVWTDKKGLEHKVIEYRTNAPKRPVVTVCLQTKQKFGVPLNHFKNGQFTPTINLGAEPQEPQDIKEPEISENIFNLDIEKDNTVEVNQFFKDLGTQYDWNVLHKLNNERKAFDKSKDYNNLYRIEDKIVEKFIKPIWKTFAAEKLQLTSEIDYLHWAKKQDMDCSSLGDKLGVIFDNEHLKVFGILDYDFNTTLVKYSVRFKNIFKNGEDIIVRRAFDVGYLDKIRS